MKKTLCVMLMVAGTVLGFQPVFVNIPAVNGASFAGIAILAIGAVLYHRSTTTEQLST